MKIRRDVGLPLAILMVAAALAPEAGRDGEQAVQIGWFSQATKRTFTVSYLDQLPQDEGVQGARLGIADNETTGQFTRPVVHLDRGDCAGGR